MPSLPAITNVSPAKIQRIGSCLSCREGSIHADMQADVSVPVELAVASGADRQITFLEQVHRARMSEEKKNQARGLEPSSVAD